MRPSTLSVLNALCTVAIVLVISGCEKKGYPGAPYGFDYRTLQIEWKYEGSTTGTRELYAETSGYENGELVFKRVAEKRNLEMPVPGRPGKTSQDELWFYNIDAKHHTVAEPLNSLVVTVLEPTPLMKIMYTNVWLEIIRYMVRRQDLSQDKREWLQGKVYSLSDEELKELGAKISEDEFMGHKVKYFEIPIAEGTAKLWLYGQLPLKLVLESSWRGRHVKNTIEATKFVLNEKLPEEPFTPPEGLSVIDRTTPIPSQ